MRLRVREELDGFLRERCTPLLATTGLDSAAPELSRYLGGGKCLRSTFVYLGWLSGAEECAAALRAAASFELLHTFALLQDDVMDESPVRRGRAAAHAHFAEWHRTRGLSGSAQRFGESAATLLGDLCLVWSEQMLRESGVAARCLQRAWPRYDAMRIELALGQCADIVNDAGPGADAVRGAGGRSREVRQLHGVPAVGDRRGDGRLRRARPRGARRIRRRGR